MATFNINATDFIAKISNGTPYTAADTVTLRDSAANIQALTAAQIAQLSTLNVDFLDSTSNVIRFSVAQLKALTIPVVATDSIVLSDSGANIAAENTAFFSGLAAKKVVAINPTSQLDLTVAQYTALGGVAIDTSATATITDSAENIAALSSTVIAGLVGKGIDSLNSSDDTLSLKVSQVLALGTVKLTAADDVTIADTGAAIAALTVAQIGTLATKGVDTLDASDDILALSVAQFNALGAVNLASLDDVTLRDTAANLAALSVATIGTLATKGIDVIDSSGNTLALTVAQYLALGDVGLDDTDTVTILDTGANLAGFSVDEIAGLEAKGVEFIDASNGTLSLTIAKFQALGAVQLTAADTVTLADTGENLGSLTSEDIAELAGKRVDKIDATDDVLVLSVAQFNAFGAVTLTTTDSVTLADTGANLGGLSAAAIGQLAGKGIDKLDVTDETGALSLTVAQYRALGAVALTADDVVTLADSGANIALMTLAEFTALATKGFDAIDASDDALSLTVAQFNALGAVTLTEADTVTLKDTGAILANLNAEAIGALAGKGIDVIDATTPLTLTIAQYQALGTVELTAADTVTLTGTGAALAELSAEELQALAGDGIDTIDATDNQITLTAAQAVALGEVKIATNDVATLSDTAAEIEALSADEIEDIVASGIDRINVAEDEGGATDISFTVAQARKLGVVVITADSVTVLDSGENIGGGEGTAGLTAAQITALRANGFTAIDATDDALTLTVAQYLALVSIELTATDFVTLADVGAEFALLSPAQISALVANGIDAIDATDDNLVLSVAQFRALDTLSPRAADNVVLKDTGAALALLTVAEITSLAGKNFDSIDSSNGLLTLTLAQYQALGSVSLTAADVVTLSATGAAIAALDAEAIGALADDAIDIIDTTDNAVTLSVAQALALGTVKFVAGDVVTVSDGAEAIQNMSSDDFAALGLSGVDFITSDEAIALTAAQAAALGTVKISSDTSVTLADEGANIADLTVAQIGALGASGVETIDATDDVLSLSVAKYKALGSVDLTADDDVKLVDTGAAVTALTTTEIAALAGKGIDSIDTTNNALTLSVAQALALGSVFVADGDVVTVSDTGTAIANMNIAQIAGLADDGIDIIDSTTGSLTLTLAQYQALGSVSLTATDVVTLSATGAAIAALNAEAIGALADDAIDIIDTTDNAVTLSVAQALALGTVKIAAGDVVTVSDTGLAIGNMTTAQIAGLAAKGVDFIYSDDAIALTAAQAAALGTVKISSDTSVTLADEGANIADLTVAQIGALGASGVETIDATDDVLSLSVAKYKALGSVDLTADDDVTLVDTGAAVTALTTTEIAALAGKGIDSIDTTNNALTLSVAQALALGSVFVADDDFVTVADTGTAIAAMTVAQIEGLAEDGIDIIDSTTGSLTLTLAQYQALGTVSLTAADVVTLSDTGTNISLLAPGVFAGFAGKGIDTIDTTNNALTLSVAQALALGTVKIAAGDVVTVSDTGSAISAMTSTAIAGLAAKGVDIIDANTNQLTLDLAQFQALGTVALTAADTVTLSDTAAALSLLTSAQITALAGKGIDKLDVTGSTLSLTLAQVKALGTVSFTAHSDVTLKDTSAAIAAMTAAQISALAATGIDTIDATDNVLNLTAAQYQALGSVSLASADAVTLRDSGTAVAALSAAVIAGLDAKGVDFIDTTNNALSLKVAQALELGDVVVAANDVVTLSDTGANIGSMLASEIAALAGNGIDRIDATNNAITLTVEQASSLGSVVIASGDVVTVSDIGANLALLTPAQLTGLAASGVDRINLIDNAVTLSSAQANALGAVVFDVSDNAVTISDTGASITALTTTQLQAWVTRGIDTIDTTNNMLSLTSAQKTALGAITIATNDVLTVNGGTGADVINGHAGVDILNGNSGGDTLNGGDGSDVLTGGGSRDRMTGGLGADTFDFNAITDSGTLSTTRDVITDFQIGIDTIDLSTIDALASTAGDGAFILDAIGTATSAVAEGHIGWYQSGGNTYLRINTDADSTIEMTLEFTGLRNFTASDFDL